jgi:lipopolysaccharide transport system permease protein
MRTIIESNTKSILDLREIFRFKDLLWNLSKRDVLVRYKQTFIGVVWAIIRPLINIVIFGFLSQFIEQTDNMAERFIQVSAGVIIWNLIATSITDSSSSILSNANILTKVYFPKIIIPLSSLTVCMIDFLISLVILLVFRFAFIGAPGAEIFLLPLVILYTLLFSFSIGLFFATLNVKYRDVKFILPFLLQIGFYVCPVFISTGFYLEKLPTSLDMIFLSNPLVAIVDGFKYCFLGEPMRLPAINIFIGIGITILLLFSSMNYFVKFEKTFADHI